MIAIIDYGMGNLRSVQKAFERLGVEATVTSDKALVESADKLVLPGVGAIADAGVTVFESTFDHRREDCVAENAEKIAALEGGVRQVPHARSRLRLGQDPECPLASGSWRTGRTSSVYRDPEHRNQQYVEY